MDLDKLSQGEKIAGASSILLFIFMFFDWFDAELSGAGRSISEGVSAWDALDAIPVILLVAAIIAALVVASIRLLDSPLEPSFSPNVIVSILGAIAFILILIEIIDPPGGSGSGPGFSFDVSPTFWIFLALVSAAGIAYGGYKAMQEEGASFGDIGDRFSGGRGSGGGDASGGDPSTPPPPPPPPASQTPPPPPPPPSSPPPQS